MMSDTSATPAFTAGAQTFVNVVKERYGQDGSNPLGINHWLVVLVERHGAMAQDAAKGLVAGELLRHLSVRIRQGETGDAMSEERLVSRARELARARGKHVVAEIDFARAILAIAGYELCVAEPAPPVNPARADGGHSCAEAAGRAGPSYQARARRPTPMLDKLGLDLTRAAADGKLNRIVEREAETDLVIETLCRRTKRNPVLVGPAGVGKTAIVEGLAQRIARGEAPQVLAGQRIISIQTASLTAGCSVVGQLEERMKAILAEASQDGIILFIDEVHTIIGAGAAGHRPGGDVANILKPALARGDIACIAATTYDEYRRFIEPDSALERRFQPIRVDELSPEKTLVVLSSLRDELAQLRHVKVADAVLKWLVGFADNFMRNRHFPDKAVDLLEQSVAFALAHARDSVSEADAEAVAKRLLGVPLAPDERVTSLRQHASRRAVLCSEDLDALAGRLEVTLRGLDLRPARPNVVVLLIGAAARRSGLLAEVIAQSLFGSADRCVTIDLGPLTHDGDVNRLIGASPGYIGYSDALPIHQLAQTPWCVLRCENVHACHPSVRDVLLRAVSDGFVTDGSGKRIYLSDAVVVMTADLSPAVEQPIGLGQEQECPGLDVREAVADVLGDTAVEVVDLICTEAPTGDQEGRQWVERELIPDLQTRYRKLGVEVKFDGSFVKWLLEQRRDLSAGHEWERLIDERLSRPLIPYLPDSAGKEAQSVVVSCREGTVRVELQLKDEEG